MAWLSFLLGVMTLGPLMLASGAMAAFSVISLWINDLLNLFGHGPGIGGFVDSLFGGPGASSGSFIHFVVFMVASLIAAGCWAGLQKLYEWTQSPSSS